MKRKECEVIIKVNGVETQDSKHKLKKEAQKRARELALERVRSGEQTMVHSQNVYTFPNDHHIIVRYIKDEIQSDSL